MKPLVKKNTIANKSCCDRKKTSWFCEKGTLLIQDKRDTHLKYRDIIIQEAYQQLRAIGNGNALIRTTKKLLWKYLMTNGLKRTTTQHFLNFKEKAGGQQKVEKTNNFLKRK